MTVIARRLVTAFVAFAAMLCGPVLALAQAEIRIMWYSDGNEGEVMRDLLDRFEKQNPDIKVILDRVPYKTILENLPQILASGQGPDMARVTDLGGLSPYFLDVTPYVKDKAYWEDNFGAVLPWMSPAGARRAYSA